nr:MAG TPA: hypothetical protein [Caudoviricetes sp.]
MCYNQVNRFDERCTFWSFPRVLFLMPTLPPLHVLLVRQGF